MTQTFDLELTAEHIRVLASLIYEPVARVWINGRWCCPFCLALNLKARPQCSCGISRDAAFLDESESCAQDEFTAVPHAGTWIPDVAAGAGLSNHRQPPPNAL
jgi:hypothetical protein